MERKIAAGGGSGIILAPLIVWLWNLYMPEAKMPGEVAAIIGGLVSMVVGWFVPNAKVKGV